VNFDPMNNVKEGWSQPISARPLMHAYECRALPENQMFVFVRGIAGVIKARRIPYFERREFRGKARSDPYYQQKGLWRKILG
jgi:type IV secretory pathway TraG/TraD family ATPase VirD4